MLRPVRIQVRRNLIDLLFGTSDFRRAAEGRRSGENSSPPIWYRQVAAREAGTLRAWMGDRKGQAMHRATLRTATLRIAGLLVAGSFFAPSAFAATASRPTIVADRRGGGLDLLRVTAETVNTTGVPTLTKSVEVEVDCGPALRRRLTLALPAPQTRIVAIPKGAWCKIMVITPPLAPYPCQWETTYSPARRAGGNGATLAVRNTLACLHSR